MLWIGYLLVDQRGLAWATVAVLGAVAVLGLIMAARWIRVYRAFAAPGPSLTRRTLSLRNGTSRCRSSSPTASWPSPPSFWCCSLRLALARRDQSPAQAAIPRVAEPDRDSWRAPGAGDSGLTPRICQPLLLALYASCSFPGPVRPRFAVRRAYEGSSPVRVRSSPRCSSCREPSQ